MYFTGCAIITENLTDHIEKGSKHECHDLLRRMHDLLLLELRDQVYQHIVGGRIVEIKEEDVDRWRAARNVRDLPNFLFHAPTKHSLMGKDLLKHRYYLCDAREISADHIMFDLVAP
jgi:hypothetical protein